MEVWRLNVILLIVVLLQGFFVYVCQSCWDLDDDTREPTLIEVVQSVGNIIYGRIRNKFPDPGSSSYQGPYTIEVEVYCILKGPRTPRIVNITGAGYIPTCCASAEFKVHIEYIVLAENSSRPVRGCGGQGEEKGLRIAHGHSEVIPNPEKLMEIRKACGLNPVTRPEGSTSTVECPVSDSDCQEKVEPEKSTEIKGPTTTDSDNHVTEKPDEKGSTSSVECHVSDSGCQVKMETDISTEMTEMSAAASSTKAITTFLSVAMIIAIVR